MAFLQDHLISIMVGGVVLLLLFRLHLESQEAGIEITTHYSGYASTLSFVETLQRDFPNIGAGVDPASPMIVDFVWTPATKYIEFRGVIDTVAAAPIELIKYQVVFSDSSVIRYNDSLQTVALFEVQRLADDGSGYKLTGSSPPTIREFDIALFDGNGLSVGSTFDDARQINIRMVTIPPLAETEVDRFSYWQTRFRPPSLTLKDP